ncbi:MAG: hypothetical protein U9Q12_01955 [Patescibacteria group bacterium]|nr:hypothetical protein [Patescibacteria group bacterium]
MNTKQGNGMVIALIVLAVAAVGIIGYMMYNNNQQQAAADAELAAQQAQTQAAQKEAADATATVEAQEKAITDATESAQAQAEVAAQKAVVDANATCEENLASAQKSLPELKDYSDLLEALGEEIDDNPDKAIEKCREINEGLSKNECDIKVNNFVDGKTEVYDELQLQIKATEDVIAAGC